MIKNGRSYGFVELGFNDDEYSSSDVRGEDDPNPSNKRKNNYYKVNGTLPTAKQALVFLLVSLNSNWKCPVGYFFIDSLEHKERANLT